MIDKFFKALVLLLFVSVTGCAKPYVQDPLILGEKPATLVLDTTLFEKRNGLPQVQLSVSEKTCNGVGRAKVDIKYLGELHNDVLKIRQEKILIPVDKKVIVSAYYSHVMLLAGTEICSIAIEFQPIPGKEYFYTAKQERETGLFTGGGNCQAGIYERVYTADAEVKLLEVRPILYGSVDGLGYSYCDDKGNFLIWSEWEKFKAEQDKLKAEKPGQQPDKSPTK